jgi:hypothetical protein
MEEREMIQKFGDLFGETLSIMEKTKKAFFSLNSKQVKEEHEKFRTLLKSRLEDAENIIGRKDKGEVEKKFVNLVIAFQTVALSVDNLMDKMEIKLDSNILFSEKALKEIEELYSLMEAQVRDARDYLLTRNPHLSEMIRRGVDNVRKLSDKYAVVHQNRLITGVCMPKASYLYIDITDSLKRTARGLAEFAERV